MEEGVVPDVDVLLGLAVSGGLARIIRATSLDVALPEQVYLTVLDELKGTVYAEELEAAVDRRVLERVAIPREALGEFFRIVAMPFTESLDDCAAAAILCAKHLKAHTLASDDEKVRRYCRKKFPWVKVISFVDFFQHALKPPGLNSEEARDLLAGALGRASIRLRGDDGKWACEFLGRDRSSSGSGQSSSSA